MCRESTVPKAFGMRGGQHFCTLDTFGKYIKLEFAISRFVFVDLDPPSDNIFCIFPGDLVINKIIIQKPICSNPKSSDQAEGTRNRNCECAR